MIEKFNDILSKKISVSLISISNERVDFVKN